MMWFYNLKIAQKLVVCFLLMIVFVIGLSVYSLLQLKQSNDELSVFRNRSLATVENVSVLQSSVYRLRNAQLGILNTATSAKDLIQFRTTSRQQQDLLKKQSHSDCIG